LNANDKLIFPLRQRGGKRGRKKKRGGGSVRLLVCWNRKGTDSRTEALFNSPPSQDMEEWGGRSGKKGDGSIPMRSNLWGETKGKGGGGPLSSSLEQEGEGRRGGGYWRIVRSESKPRLIYVQRNPKGGKTSQFKQYSSFWGRETKRFVDFSGVKRPRN